MIIILAASSLLFGYLVLQRLQLYLARRRIIQENNCKPCPYVLNRDPILGLDILRENVRLADAGRFLSGSQARFRRFKSNTFHNRIITSPIILTVEPENIKTILSLKFKDYDFSNRKVAMDPLLGDGIFNSDGARWASSRHLLRPNFAREQVADLAMLERHFKHLLKYIPADGSTVDLQDLFFCMTMDTATEFLFNHSTNSLRMLDQQESSANEDVQFARAFNAAQQDIVTRVRFGPLYRLLSKNTVKEGADAVKMCHAYVDRFVDDAVRWREEQDLEKKGSSDERYVFIHELAKQTKDKTRIRNELINILLAGRDTTASLLSNMFFEFAKRPEVWRKLREEVEGLQGRIPSYEELRGMKYVKWCLNESLRLNPVVPSNSRFAIRDTVLPRGGGPDGSSPLFVPRGTTVGYSTYTMHRRQDLYGADAEEFRPERWEALRPSWEYLPFNGGPRICLGQQYALTEAGFVTVRLAQEFKRLESRDTNGGVWVEGLTLTLCSKNGTKVGLFRE
ncbi:putative cytochrome P450 alkane hydroxylase [Sporormia fimetaria CBS 119925]|uniref:Cytochrome P450 alkane hydroxylase n=1 Tax=Sporormia fimetaria CBS 119925 TaxID=1340428 RepID=A0A6A6V091_9PLEO|nr:putative cytochrome P450 alkane hydroxylase [Sporormia fimetaria CBS 119925]